MEKWKPKRYVRTLREVLFAGGHRYWEERKKVIVAALEQTPSGDMKVVHPLLDTEETREFLAKREQASRRRWRNALPEFFWTERI